jgi:hypothetical protein
MMSINELVDRLLATGIEILQPRLQATGYNPGIFNLLLFSIAYMFIENFDENKPLNLKPYLGKMQTVLIFQ